MSEVTQKEVYELVESLQKETVKTLLTLAKDFEIVGRYDMRKQQLIEALVEAHKVAITNANVEEPNVTEMVRADKLERIESAERGMLFAFTKNDKMLFAKITAVCSDIKVIQAVERDGTAHSVPFDTVNWVKSGARWPKPIFDELRRQRACNE